MFSQTLCRFGRFFDVRDKSPPIRSTDPCSLPLTFTTECMGHYPQTFHWLASRILEHKLTNPRPKPHHSNMLRIGSGTSGNFLEGEGAFRGDMSGSPSKGIKYDGGSARRVTVRLVVRRRWPCWWGRVDRLGRKTIGGRWRLDVGNSRTVQRWRMFRTCASAAPTRNLHGFRRVLRPPQYSSLCRLQITRPGDLLVLN